MLIDTAPSQDPSPNIGHNLQKALKISGVLALVFAIWACFAHLESASIASGKVVVSSNRKSIQHLAGGRIKEIYVKEGEQVRKGAPLIQLDDTQEKVQRELISKEMDYVHAKMARLIAQVERRDTIQYPQKLLDKLDKKEVKEILRWQNETFLANEEFLKKQEKALSERIAKYEASIKTANLRLLHEKAQLAFIKEEENEVKTLFDKQLVSNLRYWGVLKDRERQEATIVVLLGEVEDAQTGLQEAIAQKESIRGKALKDDTEDLTNTQQKLFELQEKLQAIEDVIAHSLMISPIEGIVMGLKAHTLDGVIRAGDVVMEIVPKEDTLKIEAFIDPMDIDAIREGQRTKVDLLPYSRRYTPSMNGVITYVSADSFTDENNQKVYYRAYIEIPEEELSRHPNLRLYPGMPAETFIISSRQTPLEYLLKPLFRSFERAFREQ